MFYEFKILFKWRLNWHSRVKCAECEYTNVQSARQNPGQKFTHDSLGQ